MLYHIITITFSNYSGMFKHSSRMMSSSLSSRSLLWFYNLRRKLCTAAIQEAATIIILCWFYNLRSCVLLQSKKLWLWISSSFLHWPYNLRGCVLLQSKKLWLWISSSFLYWPYNLRGCVLLLQSKKLCMCSSWKPTRSFFTSGSLNTFSSLSTFHETDLLFVALHSRWCVLPLMMIWTILVHNSLLWWLSRHEWRWCRQSSLLIPTPRVFSCTVQQKSPESPDYCSSSWCTFFFFLHMTFTSSSGCPVSTTSSSWILLQFSYLPACLPACWSCVAAVKFFKLLDSTRSLVTKIAASDQQNLWKKKVVLTPWTVFLIWLFRNWVLLWN